jgi:hypothetical protein
MKLAHMTRHLISNFVRIKGGFNSLFKTTRGQLAVPHRENAHEA